MLRRKMENILLEWKNTPNKKSLIIKGARQVGKTYSVDDFAKKNYSTYIYINFEIKPAYTSIFSGDRDVDTIMERMSMYFPNTDFPPGDTLIFLDEIQNCPDARVAMKFFTIDGRYDVIATGSLLGVRYKEITSYPVGQETSVEMYSLDFEEFLWAMGVRDDIIAEVKENIANLKEIKQFFLERFNEYFKLYLITGGMPDVVMRYKNTNHFGKVLTAQKDIVNGYLDDITKYADEYNKNRIRASFQSIPVQLSKKNKKFVYSEIEERKGSRNETYGSSLSWLYDAGIVNFCYNLNEPKLPLMTNRRWNAFKIYLNDTGLLVSMLDKDLRIALMNDELYVNEGAIIENAVAEMITKNGYELDYFERKGKLEIDFILNLKGRVTAVEVKSGNNRQAKSLDSVGERYDLKERVLLERTNVMKDEDGIRHYPIFAAAFIDEL